jgi:hypothetical protein
LISSGSGALKHDRTIPRKPKLFQGEKNVIGGAGLDARKIHVFHPQEPVSTVRARASTKLAVAATREPK